MPEYFYEMNSQTDDGKSKSKPTSLAVEDAATFASKRRESTVSDDGKKNKTVNTKEVWFAGSHSDVWVRLRNPSS